MQKKMLINCLKAGIVSTLGFALLSLIISSVLLNKNMSRDVYFPCLMVASCISGAVCGVMATKQERKNGLFNGALSATVPTIVYLITSTVLQQRFEARSFLPALAILVASIGAGIGLSNRKKRIKTKNRRGMKK